MKALVTATALTCAALTSVQAGVIVSAQSADILDGGLGRGSIQSTFNSYGLIDDYVSGETDFDAYIASNPLHVWNFSLLDAGFTYYHEWFGNNGTTSATVSYDLGSVQQTLGMALWNEDGNGIGELNILGSTDGQTWTLLGSQLKPTDNPTEQDYRADVYAWGMTSARYIKLEMSKCPASDTWASCSIGEVAFNVSAVPEMSTLTSFGLGLVLLGLATSRRQRAN